MVHQAQHCPREVIGKQKGILYGVGDDEEHDEKKAVSREPPVPHREPVGKQVHQHLRAIERGYGDEVKHGENDVYPHPEDADEARSGEERAVPF